MTYSWFGRYNLEGSYIEKRTAVEVRLQTELSEVDTGTELADLIRRDLVTSNVGLYSLTEDGEMCAKTVLTDLAPRVKACEECVKPWIAELAIHYSLHK